MYNQDIYFILIVISFLLLSFLKGFYWKHTRLLFMGVFSQRYSNQYLREENAFTERVNILTFFLMCINFTMLIAKILSVIDIFTVILIFFLVVFFFIIKLVFIHFIGFLFKSNDLARLTVFFSFLFDKVLGFILFPVVLGLYFFAFDLSTELLLFSYILFMFLLILKLFWLWKLGTNSFGISKVYIFLYLCVLEIFPLLLLGKGVFY